MREAEDRGGRRLRRADAEVREGLCGYQRATAQSGHCDRRGCPGRPCSFPLLPGARRHRFTADANLGRVHLELLTSGRAWRCLSTGRSRASGRASGTRPIRSIQSATRTRAIPHPTFTAKVASLALARPPGAADERLPSPVLPKIGAERRVLLTRRVEATGVPWPPRRSRSGRDAPRFI
jgi:hypothetical protein